MENEKNESIEDIEGDTVETPEVKKDSPKAFTQADLDRVVRDRVAREKKEYSKLSDLWESEKTELTSTIENYEGIIKDIIEKKLVDIPDEYRELVKKLSLPEQWEFINKENKKLSPKKQIPVTPNPAGSESKPAQKIKKFI